MRELQVVLIAANQVMLEIGHAETYRPIFDQEVIPPSTKKSLRITLQAVKVMNDTLACYRAVTALVNHLATGRKKLEIDNGEDPPLFPLLLLRRPEAKIESDDETIVDRAKAYSDELAWLQDIVRQWNQDAEHWRLKNGLKESKERISPLYQRFLDGYQFKAGSMQYVSCLVATVASRLSDLPEVKLQDWAKRQSSVSPLEAKTRSSITLLTSSPLPIVNLSGFRQDHCCRQGLPRCTRRLHPTVGGCSDPDSYRKLLRRDSLGIHRRTSSDPIANPKGRRGTTRSFYSA